LGKFRDRKRKKERERELLIAYECISHVSITPNFPSGFNQEIVGDYVQI
jgi:hypothetical protein